MRIDRVALTHVRIPLVEPFRTAGGVVEARRVLLVELTDSTGVVAWSECVAESRPTYSPDTVDGSWLAIVEWIAPALLGQSVDRPVRVDALLQRAVRGNARARA